MQDGTRFFQYFKLLIEDSPLQLYSAALLFSPDQSITGNSFQQESLGGVTLLSRISHWHPCLQTLEGHQYSVSLLSVSPDGVYYLSASEDGYIKIWDSTSGDDCLSLYGHSDEITSVLWSEDCTSLISASYDKTIKIWDLGSGECTSTLYGHSEGINRLLWSSDEAELVSASNDSTVKIWSRADGQCIKTLEGHSGAIKCLCWISDERLASASKDATIRIWDSKTGESIVVLEGHDKEITSLLATRGGNRLISGGRDGTTKIWNMSMSQPQCIMSLEAGTFGVNAMAMSPNNKLLAISDSIGTMSIWDVSLGKCLMQFRGSFAVHSFIWLNDGRIATTSQDSTIEIWDSFSGERVSVLKGHSARVSSIILSRDASVLLSASWDKSVKIWDLSTPIENDIEMLEKSPTYVIASPDGTLFASVYSGTVEVWDSAAGHCVSTFESHGDTLFGVSWWSADSLAICLRDEKKIRIWNSRTQELVSSFESFDTEDDHWVFTSITKSRIGSRLVAASDHDNVVKAWDSATGKGLQTSKIEGYRTNTSCSYDGTHIATVSEDQTINVWDSSTGTLVSTLEGHRSPDEDTAVGEWRVNSKGLVQDPFSKQWISLMEIWTVKRNAVLNTFLCWSQDGKWLVSASLKKIKLWDIATGQCILVLDAGQHAGKIRFSESNPNLLHTSIGSFDLGLLLTTDVSGTTRVVTSPRPKGYGFSADRVWVTLNGENSLWLPPDYRPESFEQAEVHGNTVVIGCVTGQILMLNFPEEYSSSW